MPLLPDRKNFHLINAAFLDPLVLEAVDLDDLESIEGILSWRDVKAKEIGLNDVDKKLLMMQKKAQAGKHLHFSYLLSTCFPSYLDTQPLSNITMRGKLQSQSHASRFKCSARVVEL